MRIGTYIWWSCANQHFTALATLLLACIVTGACNVVYNAVQLVPFHAMLWIAGKRNAI